MTARSPCGRRAVVLLLLLALQLHVQWCCCTSLPEPSAAPSSASPSSSASLSSSASASDPCAASLACAASFRRLWAAAERPLRRRSQGAVRCPAGCIELTRDSSCLTDAEAQPPAVFGSYPYDGSSSACLAGIHCGIVSNAEGGWLQTGRFGAYHQPLLLDLTQPQADDGQWQYRSHSPANVSGHELFPFNSSLPSLSNGVQSLHAAAGDGCLSCTELRNTSAADASWVVWGRGTLVPAPSIAPWPARAGHVQASLLYTACWLVIGGRNATHYLNDVWLGEYTGGDDWGVTDFLTLDSAATAQWMRLPDAPFTGRSDARLQVHTTAIVLYGGQTGHQCGLQELGVCSDEVWILDLTRNDSSPTFGLTLSWRPSPRRLPVAVCDATLLESSANIWAPELLPALLIGGQLSYTDPSCQRPILTTNDVYYSADSSRWLWKRAASAPFSPRRSAVVDRSFYAQYAAGNPGLMQLPVRGGVRYLSHALSNETGVARLTAAELYADVWGCELDSSVVGCSSWVRYASSNDGASVIASLPFPVVRRGPTSAVVGGRTSAAAVRAWQQTRPWTLGDDSGTTWAELPVNATHIMQPLLVRIDQWSGLSSDASDADVSLSRYQLPLLYRMDEAELNDPHGPWLAGSDWLILNTVPGRPSTTVGQTVRTSAHPLPSQLLQRAEDSTLWVQQAASAVNTTRALFDVSLRLFDVSGQCQDAVNIAQQFAYFRSPLSGGQRGNEFFSHWLTYPTPCCPPPSDPTYRALLGNGRIPDPELRQRVEAACLSHDRSPIVPWRCADGFHLEPPHVMDGREAQLKCLASQLWVDADSGVVSSCVKDRLSCSFPLLDLGDAACVLPSPRITAISIASGFGHARCGDSGGDALSLVDCPLVPLLLSISGSWFAQPLQIWVGGQPCLHPALHDVNGTETCNGGSGGDCLAYGSGATCELSGVQGRRLPVALFSGPDQQPAATQPPPSVSFAAPLILNVSSALHEMLNVSRISDPPVWSGSCQRRSGTQLTHCSHDAPFPLLVLGRNFWMTVADNRMPNDLPAVTAAPLRVSHCRVLGTDALLHPAYSDPSSELNLLLCKVTAGTDAPLMTDIPLLLRQQGGLSNLLFDASVLSPATIALRGCDAGLMEVAAGGGTPPLNASARCQPCPAGSSTEGRDGQTACERCPVGTAATGPGAVHCTACAVNSFANETGLPSCHRCPPNSYQLATRSADCHVCDLNQYLRWTADGPQCEGCLASDVAHCLPNGSIQATAAGVYLVHDDDSGLLSSVTCGASRCLAASSCQAAGGRASAAVYAPTGLSVINCCSANRLPAVDNPLCGRCLDGYEEWSGTCLPCDWQHVSVGLLLSTALLGLLLVWALHRLPDDSNSATLSVFLYFVQTSLLFFSSEPLPQALSLFNLNLLGDWPRAVTAGTAVCMLPLAPMQKIALSIAMPGIAVLYLLPLLALQLAAARCLAIRGRTVESSRPYLLFFGGVVAEAPADCPTSGEEGGSPVACEAELRPSSAAVASSSQSTVIRQSYSGTMIRLLLFGYTSTAELSLSFLHCQQVGAQGSFLHDWPAVSCASAEYRRLLPVAIAVLLLLVIVPPAALTAVLWLQRDRVARRMAVVRPATTRAAAAAGSYLSLQDAEAAGHWLARLTDKLELLYAVYRPGCSWYAVVALLRRLLLVALFVFVPPASAFLWLGAACGCLLMLHCTLWPYRRRLDNATEWLTLLALFLQCACIAQTPLPWSATEDVAARVTALLLLVALPAALVVASALPGRLWRSGQPRWKRKQRDQLLLPESIDALD